ncbi:hypothetical protein J1N35_033864 [Gossypium stocksii]|uniref:Uncharacterized protein n=1 Tax=Gossypium stocksii TaxID=47602 RepID=A0A9D3URU7_9ROSI|nr:hypothetical protein J1N35_033864 [Gossypium stocksii]
MSVLMGLGRYGPEWVVRAQWARESHTDKNLRYVGHGWWSSCCCETSYGFLYGATYWSKGLAGDTSDYGKGVVVIGGVKAIVGVAPNGTVGGTKLEAKRSLEAFVNFCKMAKRALVYYKGVTVGMEEEKGT